MRHRFRRETWKLKNSNIAIVLNFSATTSLLCITFRESPITFSSPALLPGLGGSNKMVYIRQDKLPKLKEYKYSGVDHSLVSRYILKPFYTNFVIHCFPMSMA
jgi:hypothetical protein